ncbi:MAG TPA: VanW family protein [Anaerolineales bacterium]|nr:VanW family protein [Anaerolineales bacterium]
MSSLSPIIPRPVSRPDPTLIFPQVILAFLGGLLLTFLAFSSFAAGYQYRYSGLIFPGVSIAGIDVSGLTPDEASARLWDQLTYPRQGHVAFQDGSTIWVAAPGELGLVLDANNSAVAAYQVGRSGNSVSQFFAQISALRSGKDLPPLLVYDENIARNYLLNLAATIDRPTVEANIGVNGVDVILRSGQIGRKLDVDAILPLVGTQMTTLTDGLIPLVIHETPPVIFDASEQAEITRQILSAPLVLTTPVKDGGEQSRWEIDVPTLAGMLAIERTTSSSGGEQYQVGISSEYLRGYLVSIAPGLERYPVNAHFIFNDDTRQLEVLEPSTTGRSLLIEDSLTAIQEKLAGGEHTVELVLDYTLPAAPDTATAADLGITELVSVQTSYFYGSSAERIQNITVASSRFHGVLVAPGETFSMASILGDVSLDNGFAEAWIIFGDRTIKGVGGGVCQVSTTFFRTVFFGGFQIDERYSHAYRVTYYEQTASGGVNANLAGLDATVYVPLVDFKFTNDTPYWLLMETYVNPGARTLTWKFYSTSDGRTVEWNTTGLQNIEDPPDPQYIENPKLAKGEIKQVDWAVAGADVTVTRTVTRNGTVLHGDTFVTHYQPWRAVYEYGPGTKLPKDADNSN